MKKFLLLLFALGMVTDSWSQNLDTADVCQVAAVKAALQHTVKQTNSMMVREASITFTQIQENNVESIAFSRFRHFDITTSNGISKFKFRVLTHRGPYFRNQERLCRVTAISKLGEEEVLGGDSDNSHGIQNFTGTVVAGLAAIGGETTGIGLRLANGDLYELVLAEGLRDDFTQLDGATVEVTGRIVYLEGVEIPRRVAIEVSSYRVLDESNGENGNNGDNNGDNDNDGELRSFTGIITGPLAGIGGETTGIGIRTEAGELYELVLDEGLQAEFQQLEGQRVQITGRLVFLEGVEHGRYAIQVESYEVL